MFHSELSVVYASFHDDSFGLFKYFINICSIGIDDAADSHEAELTARVTECSCRAIHQVHSVTPEI